MKMGRSSASGLRITVFGSSGFLGRYVVSRLAGVGCQMVLPYRGDELYMRHLKLMGDLGGINFVKGTIRSLDDIQAAVSGSDVVINLLGIRQETRRAIAHAPVTSVFCCNNAGVVRSSAHRSTSVVFAARSDPRPPPTPSDGGLFPTVT
jgi:uncharacterized protein YbjT (DUF2867 family)